MGVGHGPGRSAQEDLLGAGWERHRPAVFGVAYRLLGSVADAEDVTQDVWLRAAGADLRGLGGLRAWLVTVAARRSYDILKSARFRRETYVGPWLPEPLLTGPDASEPVLADDGRAVFFVAEPDRVRLADLAQRLRDGRLKPIVGATRTLPEAPSAFAPDQRTPGKTMIQVTEEGVE
jgi:DNA-directed RNA polymerase specialized sigma24 family protein